MFQALFCILWFLMVYEGNWLLAVAVAIWLGSAMFVDYVTKFMMKFPDEDQDFFYDAESTHSQFFFDANSEVGSGVSNYETASEDSVYEDFECCILYKPKVKYCEEHMEKFLNDCLDESGLIRFENIRWIIGPLPPPEENEQLRQFLEKVRHPKPTNNDENLQENERGHQPQKGKGSLKKRFKKLFCCCCSCCGRQD